MKDFKRLTAKEANQFYTKEEDKLDSSLVGYTMVKDMDGWDTVTYYTNRRKTSKFKGEGRYYVYILENESIPGQYKIGYTGKTPEERAKQLSKSTGVPTPFKVVYAFKCHDGERAEYEVHKELAEYRINSEREFFNCTLSEATQAIEKVIKRYNEQP